DHPKVLVFRKVRQISQGELARLLAPNGIPPINVNGVSGMPQEGLLLSAADRAIQQAGGTWRAIFDAGSFANRYPALVWFLVVQALGLLALPLTLRLFRGLPD